MKKLMVLALALLLAISAFAACGSSASTSGSAAGGTSTAASGAPEESGSAAGNVPDMLVVAVPEAPVYVDPHIQATVATYRVTTQMFDRLVQLDQDMQIVPKLAESWEVENDTTTIFHLRQGVKFHNGETMTAEDVKYSLERCMASDGVNYNYLIIDRIEIVDDYTVKIITKEPFNALLSRLTLDAASIISKKAAESGEDFNAHPVGAGPFKFVSWDIGGDVVLEAFEDYYGGASPLKKLIFRTVPEAINRTIGLETGEIGLAYDLDPTDMDTVRGNENLQLLDSRGTSSWYLGSNCKKPILEDVRVRQAIAYAVNKQDFIDITFGGSATMSHNTMLYDGLFGYAPDTVTYDTDIDKAKELLAEAGYPDGFDTTLWCIDTQKFMTGAVVIQDQLKKIGINVEVKSMDNATFTTAVGAGEHDLFLAEKVAIDPDSMLRSMYHTEALGLSGNRSFWTTPEVDKLLDEASTTTDMAKSEELYVQAQTIIAEQVPVYPLAIDNLNGGAQNYVKGFRLYPGFTHFIYGTYLEA